MAKSLIIKILLLAFSLEVIVILVNIKVDPDHYFNKDAKDISSLLLSGKTIAQYPNDLDFRHIHLDAIADDRFNAKIICVGSSRGWQLNNGVFAPHTFYNACVGAANLTDYMAIYHVLQVNHKLPDTLVLAVDPWIIDDSRGANHNISPFSIFSYHYRAMATEIGISNKYKLFTPGMLLARYLTPYAYELASFGYFQTSLKNIFLATKRPWHITENTHDTCKLLLPDASIMYPEWFTNLKEDTVKQMALHFASEESHKKFDVSEFNLHMITLFLQKIREDKVVPVIFLTPYNPLAFDIINRYNGSLEKDEQAIKKIALTENIECIGTFNPHLCNFDISYFYDYYHVKRKGIEELYVRRQKFLAASKMIH